MIEREKIPKRTEASSKVAQYRGNTGFIWGSKLAQNIVNKLSRKFSLSCDRFFFIVSFFLQTKEKSAKVIQLGRNWSRTRYYTHFFHKTLMMNMTDCSTDRHNYKKKAWNRELLGESGLYVQHMPCQAAVQIAKPMTFSSSTFASSLWLRLWRSWAWSWTWSRCANDRYYVGKNEITCVVNP